MKSYFVVKTLTFIIGIGFALYVWFLTYSYITPVCLPETTNIAGFRYRMYFDDQVLGDAYENVALEMSCYAYEYKFPYLYAYGELGYTKICVLPLFTKIIKIENYASDARVSPDIATKLVSNLRHLQRAYGTSLILIENMDDISIEDKRIFLELRRRGEESKKWSLEAAKNSQRRDIIRDLDEISEVLEESLRRQELEQEQE
ncbi:hypothetical protein AAAV92_10385 [Selenomonas noxia]|uniref:hypothetical protein n=1 Tax=Selenomonas noxia TaxID=135083 RepID=UPI0032C0E507